jgi:hypothetical protein
VCREISEICHEIRNRTVLLAENKIDPEKIKEKTEGKVDLFMKRALLCTVFFQNLKKCFFLMNFMALIG